MKIKYKREKMPLLKTFYISIMAVISTQAFALNQVDKSSTPVMLAKAGIQENNSVIEVNPLIMANQGIGLNSEVLIAHHTSVGGNFEYYAQTLYNSNNTQAIRNMINIAPFIRYYIFSPQLSGLFLGLKLNLFYSQAQISDTTESASYNNSFVAPTMHFGYRFVTQKCFTFSAYAGIGIKSSNNKFPADKIPATRTSNQDWSNALDLLNTNVTSKQPDYGLTFGYIF